MIAQKLIECEVNKLKNCIDRYSERKIAIFPAGNNGQLFFRSMKENFGVEAEFFIDNDPVLAAGGVLFKPWESDPDFAKKYFILIATKPLWAKQISSQLSELGIPNISSDAYTATLLWDRAKSIVRLLDDDYSRAAYLGLIWYWLTYDISLCQSSGNQYFDVVSFSNSILESIVDLGAHVGSITEEYVKRSFGNCKIYAFEPDEGNREALELRVKRLKSEWRMEESDLIVVSAGASAKTGDLCFKIMEKSTDSFLSDSGERSVKVYALDDFFKDKQPPTIIKADIEGAEQDMLYGSERIIRNYKPKIVISIYHSSHDFVRIVEIIKDLNAAYNFAVRTHSADYLDTVLYCY
jgi:FkbM family methyltransferase